MSVRHARALRHFVQRLIACDFSLLVSSQKIAAAENIEDVVETEQAISIVFWLNRRLGLALNQGDAGKRDLLSPFEMCCR
jgi:hypothetical protein